MKIQEVTIFAYATKGEALEVANRTVEDTCIASIVILNGLRPAERPVCFLVVPTERSLVPKEG